MKKKIIALSCIVSVVVFSCKKDEVETTPATTTTTGTTGTNANSGGVLEPTQTQKALLVEGTAAWCGYCPKYGTETMKQMIVKYPTMVAIALHSGDALSTAYTINNTLSGNFSMAGIPDFYVGNTDASQSPESKIISAQNQTPTAAVGHTWTKGSDNKYTITAKVKFYTASSGSYYVATYALQNNIPAAKSKTLDQHDYMSILQTGTASTAVTIWNANEASDGAGGYYFKTGDTYYHNHILTAVADGITSNWGQALTATTINANDTFDFSFTITPASTWTSDIEIITVLWKKNGSKYTYVNGYFQ